MPKFAKIILFACLVFSVAPTMADERTDAAIETRQGLLKLLGFYLGPIVGMARQQIPYDADTVRANAEKIATLAPLIPDVFRNDSVYR